ncbi:MAG: tryptophan 2,3-dioxygenase [Xanthomonadaceae bacterium]|nr:tryptophan 2,3-dioxygenase [Xanthomonadaceae bacterium]
MTERELEPGIPLDLEGQLTYGDYLGLAKLLDAQHPLSKPPHHDEMLFIIQHQTSELWIKLMLHELQAAIDFIRNDDVEPCFKILARVKQIQQQLFNQWAVLETLTPSEYLQFRGVLQAASGFQSFQYRALEFILGNKHGKLAEMHRHEPAHFDALTRLLNQPSLYDEFLRYLHRQGLPIPADRVERDWTQPYESSPGVVRALKGVYEDPNRYWGAYELAEKLVDVEELFQLWRFRHMKTVERIIGHRKGTGGSSGVGFLKKALDIALFPELIEVRTEL